MAGRFPRRENALLPLRPISSYGLEDSRDSSERWSRDKDIRRAWRSQSSTLVSGGRGFAIRSHSEWRNQHLGTTSQGRKTETADKIHFRSNLRLQMVL